MPDVQRRTLDQIFARSLLAAESLASELRERILRSALRLPLTSPEAQLASARAILEAVEPVLAEMMTDAEIAAWVAGNAAVTRQLSRRVLDAISGDPPQQPPSYAELMGGEEPIIRFPLIERAAENLAERQIVTREEFDRLVGDARTRAFTVARQSSDDAIETIRNTLVDVVRKGASLDGFRTELGDALAGSFIGPAHLETVYRTNIQTAFHRAHDELADLPVVSEVFPYQEYLPIDDARVRPNHLALGRLGLNGTGIYRRDDPMWDLFQPPWDYNCRCGVNLLTVEAAAEKGVIEARTWLRTGQPPAVPEWRIDAIPFRPDPGFQRLAA